MHWIYNVITIYQQRVSDEWFFLFLLTSSPDLMVVWEPFQHWCSRFITCCFRWKSVHISPASLKKNWSFFEPCFVRWSTDDIMSKWSTMKLFHVLRKNNTKLSWSFLSPDVDELWSYVLGHIFPTRQRGMLPTTNFIASDFGDPGWGVVVTILGR